MTTCTIIGVVVHCVLAAGPRPTPAQAAATLQAASPAYVQAPPVPFGPVAASTGTTGPSSGPWQWPAPTQFFHYNTMPWEMHAYTGHQHGQAYPYDRVTSGPVDRQPRQHPRQAPRK
jgi:hypothetical protein